MKAVSWSDATRPPSNDTGLKRQLSSVATALFFGHLSGCRRGACIVAAHAAPSSAPNSAPGLEKNQFKESGLLFSKRGVQANTSLET
jgi:hypothetical protein